MYTPHFERGVRAFKTRNDYTLYLIHTMNDIKESRDLTTTHQRHNKTQTSLISSTRLVDKEVNLVVVFGQVSHNHEDACTHSFSLPISLPTLYTSLISCLTHVCKSQSRRVESQDPDRANMPSELTTTSDTKWLWPRRAFLAMP